MNEQQPLVSIITIVFNGEKHLQQTIESVLGQTYPNVEYIIIDGGSTDNTVSIINKYSSHLVYWISEKDKGISDAFNKGISKATGDIIGLINADDWYENDTVEKVVTAMKDHDVAYGNVVYWKNNKKEMVTYGRHDYLINEMTVNHPTVFVKRDCYKRFGYFDKAYKFAMDYDFLLRLKINNCSFTYLPSVFSNMRWDGVSDKQWYKASKEALQIKNKYLPKRKLLNAAYFIKQVSAISLARFLQNLHLDNVVRFYRGRLSHVKKIHY
jgi:glycosyltransferase involved in cell wall biosynthesis